MNQLSLARRAAIVRCLVDGLSIRATCRVTGASKNTVTRLLVDLGEACRLYLDRTVRGVKAKRIQCDEIWAFVGAKQKNLREGEVGTGRGDAWTWTAIDADSKLLVSYLVGRRTASAALDFMADLQLRLAGRVQMTTDGNTVYLEAVDRIFGGNVDYAMLVKVYGTGDMDGTTATRYSPPVCVGAQKIRRWGNPDPDHVSTSYVERANLTMRMGMRRFTRLTNAFSKKLENHAHAVALHFMHYNFCRAHATLTQDHPRHYPTTPAMAAGLANHVWTVEEMCALLTPAKRP